MNTLGDRIKILRKSLSYNQSEFAKVLGIKQDMLSRYENNKTKTPNDIMDKIHNKFNTSIDWLFSGKGEMHLQTSETPEEPHSQKIEKTEDQERKEATIRFVQAIRFLQTSEEITTKSEIARRIGVSSSLLTELTKGRALVTPKSIKQLTDAYKKINKHWIQTGRGEMSPSSTTIEPQYYKTSEIKEVQKPNIEAELLALKAELKSKDDLINTLNELINAKNETVKALKEQIDSIRGSDQNKQAV